MFVVVLIAGLLLSGCSSGGGAGSSGNAQKTQKSATGDAQASSGAASSKANSAKKSGASGASAGNSSTMPALAGIQSADRIARKWHEDAKLYSIASLTSDVDAKGRASGWLYSYVSTSAKAVVLISVEDNKAKIQQEPPVPDSQIKQIASHALPPPGELIDSPEAIYRTKKVKKAIQQNPDARVSAGLDSFSSEQPIWILSTISKGRQRVEERVTASS